jgi:predicted MFS family arabinose efflux permease
VFDTEHHVAVATTMQRAVRYGSMPLLALAATVALEAGERQSLSHAVEGLQRAFHLSDAAVGSLPLAMALVGAVGAIPIGILADRGRRVPLLAWAVVVWTVCMALNGLAPTFAFLVLGRLGVGAVEANGPAAVSLLSDYYPAKDRARKLGLYQAGAVAGAVVGLGAGGIAVALGGWRWAFFLWIPFGIATALFVWRQPEPERGAQDADYGDELSVALPVGAESKPMDFRAVLRIRSMWFGIFVLTISTLLLTAVQFWAVPYLRRAHGLDAAAAGGVGALIGIGAIVGMVLGGVVADRLLARGVQCARIYVVAGGSVAAAVVLLPAFASRTLLLTAPLLFLGGALLTMPVAPAEAWLTDVVVPELRGRAATLRSVVRTLGNAGPLVVGLLSSALETGGMGRGDALRWGLVGLTPLYAAGGLVALFAVRSYPADLSAVLAASRRSRT